MVSGELARHRLPALAIVLGFVAAVLFVPASASAQFPGGFVERAPSLDVRPALTRSEIQALLPARGPFTFPPPYLTQGIRITNASDCGGADCVDYVGYSYWRRMNNHVGSDTILIFLTMDRARGGAGPTLFGYDKLTEAVTNLGPLFDPASALSWATGETWYFSATQPTKLYLNDGPRLLRYDVLAKQFQAVLDVSSQPAPLGPNRIIWQMHSSNDDRVHSATLKDGTTYADLGCFAYREDTRRFFYYPQLGINYDECQVDKSGQWLLIKEKLGIDPASEVDNRIIDLTTGVETDLLDRNGAGGHSDDGFGYTVAADNWNALPNAIRVWQFGQSPLQGPVVYYTAAWTTPGPQHLSHANAKPGTSPAQQYVCGSGATAVNASESNEIICFRLDGSLDVLIVAPVMTDMNAPGGGDAYSKLPKGDLDVTGQYFIWTSNMGGSRLDAFVVKVPAQLLVTDTTPPVVAITAPPSGTTVAGTVTVSAIATDSVGVVGVQFKLDGKNLGVEAVAAPYAIAWDTATVASGTHTLTAVARDAAGNVAISPGVSVLVWNADTTPPTVSITSPLTGATVSGTATVSATASDEVGVAGVQFRLDGANLGAEVTQPPYSIPWGTTAVPNGAHTLTAVARDPAGNVATATPVTVTVSNGGTLTVQSVIWTDLVNVTATGSSLQKTSGCDGCADAGAVSRQQISTGDGYVELTASETSALRLAGLSTGNPGTSGSEIRFAIRLQAGTAEVRESGVYRTDTTFASGDVFRVAVESGVVTYSRNGRRFYTSTLAPAYPLLVDTSLNNLYATVSNAVIASGSAPDTIPPTASITAPASGASVVGTVAVSASATDNVRVAGVQFKLDGVNLGAEVTSPPYTVSWATTSTANGPHTLTAVARDAVGNSIVSAAVGVTVGNDTTPPVISGVISFSITASGATIGWTTSEPADSQVEYGLTTAYGKSTLPATTPVVSHSQGLSGLAPGTVYHYRVKSRDPAGNLAVSGDFTFKTRRR